METCANCGSSIGNLETPFLWKNVVVCGPCYAKLSAPYVVGPAQTFDSLEDLAMAAQKQPPPVPYVAPVPIGLLRALPIVCRTCGAGELVNRKRFRMSMPVVVIGFILLIPSVIGIIFWIAMGLLSEASIAQVSATDKQQARDQLTQASIPGDEIDTIMNSQPLTQEQADALTADQKRVTDEVATKLSVSQTGSGIAGGLFAGASFLGAIFCFVSGLLGWLLVMRKRVLQCQHCGAVVAAS